MISTHFSIAAPAFRAVLDAPATWAADVDTHGSPFDAQLDACRSQAWLHCSALPAPYPAHTLFFSVADALHRAHVVHARGDDFASAWSTGVAQLRRWMARRRLHRPVLRVDWVAGARAVSWEHLGAQLDLTRPHHFRQGLALDSDFACAFTEQELNTHGMLGGGADPSRCAVDVPRLQRHAQARIGGTEPPTLPPAGPVYLLALRGVFCGVDGVPHLLGGSGPDTGRRTPRLDADTLLQLARDGADHLARRAWSPDSTGAAPAPCPASVLTALLDVWELTRDPSLCAAIDRGVAHLTGAGLRRVNHPDAGPLAFAVEGDGPIRLAQSADCLRALLRHGETTGTARHRPLLAELAAGLVFMQDPASGRFREALDANDLTREAPGPAAPVDGNAIHALLRMYAADGNPRWLAAARLGANRWLAMPAAPTHDAWLPAAIAELTCWRPAACYDRLGLLALAGRLDDMLACKATDPALLVTLLAAQRMLAQIDSAPHLRALLRGIDREKFTRVLVHRAHHQLNALFWPETAMYQQPPVAAEGAFFARQQGLVADLGETARSVSALLGYRRWLVQPRGGVVRTASAESLAPASVF